jgi:hypothetical protein
MRVPGMQVTLRATMISVAVVALGLAIAEEFRDGTPPGFVIRSIPKRIAQLRSGTTPEQAYEILGLKQTWLLGGTGPSRWYGIGRLGRIHEHHSVGEAQIFLTFTENRSEERRLVQATVYNASLSARIAEMPGSRW